MRTKPSFTVPLSSNSLPLTARPGEVSTQPSPEAIFTEAQIGSTAPALQLLIVEDEASARRLCCEVGASIGLVTEDVETVQEALTRMEARQFDLLLLDLELAEDGGLALLSQVRELYPKTTVIVTTAFASVSSAVEAMRLGAADYLARPFSMEELRPVLERASQSAQMDISSRSLRDRLRTRTGLGKLVGTSAAMEKVYRILSKVAFSTHPVLILGESGTGKELVARAIHENGPNSSKPFLAVDCSALVPTLIESELFGHVKGAFTGANRAKEGLLAAAGEGIVFLDEIGELPLDLQAKLLRALQERELRPVGATHSVPFRARVLAATNRDLIAMVERGQFRKDLYFRLNVVNLRIPPLRERREDIPMLAQHFLDRLAAETSRPHKLSDEAFSLLMAYDWPGNVRELQHVIERTSTMSSGPVMHTVDLPTQLQNFREHLRADAADSEGAHFRPGVTIADMEKQAILSMIRQLNGDKLKAARLLGIGKTTLYRKLKEYGISDSAALTER